MYGVDLGTWLVCCAVAELGFLRRRRDEGDYRSLPPTGYHGSTRTWLQPPQNPMATSLTLQGPQRRFQSGKLPLQKINPSLRKPSASREDESIDFKRDLTSFVMRPSISSASDLCGRTETKQQQGDWECGGREEDAV